MASRSIHAPADGSPVGRTLLGVFAKYWAVGQVKTRLAASIGDVTAAQLHRQFVETTLARMGGIASERWLAVAPAEMLPQFERLVPVAAGSFRLLPQSDGDLGRRMRHFFDEAFGEGFGRVVLIGSDSPDLPLELVDQAFDRLSQVSVVLGPSIDGGYYLVGAACATPSIFEGIAWSTGAVLAQTQQRLSEERIPYSLLEPWSDVDEWVDLVALIDRLRQRDLSCDRSLADLLASLRDHEHMQSSRRP